MTPTIPRKVTIEDDAVVIEWSDGAICRYGHRDLRLACACAACMDEMSGRRVLKPAQVPEDVFAVDYLKVGKYALQFLWSDGHATGIYPFRMLREMCKGGSAAGG
ncbi:MAG: DUF971 domain-containing protein [Chloroflexi bacterium]|nr:DUF971 domain-containing protein [Chloroflexota bacterium]